MRVLVVGGDGLIGRALATHPAGAHEVVATTRRPGGRGLSLDLAADWPDDPTAGFDAVVIAAAVTGRAACEADPAATAAVNVAAPERLARPALARGAHVLLLSTHIVLGGARPALPAGTPYAPCDRYSAQKAEAERRLGALPGAEAGLSILRLTKVLDASAGPVAGWALAIAEGRPVEVYTDLAMAPVTVADAVAAAVAIVAARQPGIAQLSGWPEVSYAEFAGRLAARLGWDPALIRPVAGRPVNPVAAATPPHASLACPAPVPTGAVIEAVAAQLQGGPPAHHAGTGRLTTKAARGR